MSRLARIVVPGVPHRVTQRGNCRMPVFSEAGDYAFYRDLLAVRLRHHEVACWAYCLMPNQVHLILTPPEGDAAAATNGLSRIHRDCGRTSAPCAKIRWLWGRNTAEERKIGEILAGLQRTCAHLIPSTSRIFQPGDTRGLRAGCQGTSPSRKPAASSAISARRAGAILASVR